MAKKLHIKIKKYGASQTSEDMRHKYENLGAYCFRCWKNPPRPLHLLCNECLGLSGAKK
jgi:hypothetical protein